MTKKEFFQLAVRLFGVWLVAQAIIHWLTLLLTAYSGLALYRHSRLLLTQLEDPAHPSKLKFFFDDLFRTAGRESIYSVITAAGMTLVGIYCVRGGKKVLSLMRLGACENEPAFPWTTMESAHAALRLMGLCFLWQAVMDVPQLLRAALTLIVGLSFDWQAMLTPFAWLAPPQNMRLEDGMAISGAQMSFLATLSGSCSFLLSLAFAIYFLRGAPRFARWMDVPSSK